MPNAEEHTVVDARIEELENELADVLQVVQRIDLALAELQRMAAADPEFAADAEYADRTTVEGGRKAIMERRRAEIEAEIARLRKVKRI
jgi:hypothetical protein